MAIYIMLLRNQSRNRRVIRYCMSARIPKILSHLNVLIRDNDIVCIDKLRMDINVFHILASLAKNIGGLTDSKNMSSIEKLAMFLNILAHHKKNMSIKVDYIRSGWSVSRAFNECLRVILKLTPVLLVKPNLVLKDDTDDRWKWFKGCLGALDGTYISIRVEAIYKNLNFIYVLPGWERSAANDRVLRDVVVQRNGLKIERASSTAATSNTSRKRERKSTPSSRRIWTPEEELTLVDGLKELCVNGWRGDNGTFRHVYLMVLEHYMNARHPKCGLKSLPHVDPNAKSMNLKKWPLFADREEIFGKDKATREFVEGLGDVEEIEKLNLKKLLMAHDASGTREDKAAQEDLMYQLEQHKVHLLLKMNLMNKLEQHKVHSQLKKVKPINLRNNVIILKHHLLKSTKKVDAKKETTEDDNEIVLRGLMEVMKQFTESHDKKMASLIDKLGERDLSEICGKIFSIIGSPAFEIYNSDERVKAAMRITQDIKRMKFFLSISELERHKEELTLVDGLKKLCANDWKEDDGTFKHGYLMELEQHMIVCHPNCRLQSSTTYFFKNTRVEKAYMTLSLVKSRSGLGFRYNDGTILVDDPKAWDDFIKVDPYAKSMTFKKWPLFANWEEIFRKDGATEQSAEGQKLMMLQLKKKIIAQGEPSVSAGATQSSWSAF
ncbi:hypothetical protein H5410_011286 [Solanum commersonii]|uniref:DUF8040 domain-containing protein n=1 Tax=Solanum commersonii TaxID=4109 RepID=A0A9J6ANY1_SOLCO|nr:hypothetical protein H5410_011286 [Solanum commersonii]